MARGARASGSRGSLDGDSGARSEPVVDLGAVDEHADITGEHAAGPSGKPAIRRGGRRRGRSWSPEQRAAASQRTRTRLGTSAKKGALDLSWLNDWLVLAHAGIAAQVQMPELLLGADEAGQITDAAAAVARHYDIAVLDPKIMDWLRLGGVMCGVYGGKAIAVYQRKSMASANVSRETFGQAQEQAANGLSSQAQPVPVNVAPYGSGAVN